MRILCKSADDFLRNLKATRSIYLEAIWFDVSYDPPLNDDGSVGHEVIAQFSCVVLNSQGEYILQGGESCGKDFDDGDGEKDGTKRAEEIRGMLSEKCAEMQWELIPGLLEF